MLTTLTPTPTQSPAQTLKRSTIQEPTARWQDQWVSLLIEMYGEQQKSGGLFKPSDREPLVRNWKTKAWDVFADILHERCQCVDSSGNSLSGKQVRSKWDELSKKFRKINAAKTKAGLDLNEDTEQSWKWYNQIMEIHKEEGEYPRILPRKRQLSSDEQEEQEETQEGDVDDLQTESAVDTPFERKKKRSRTVPTPTSLVDATPSTLQTQLQVANIIAEKKAEAIRTAGFAKAQAIEKAALARCLGDLAAAGDGEAKGLIFGIISRVWNGQ